jgi:hypothetical protein
VNATTTGTPVIIIEYINPEVFTELTSSVARVQNLIYTFSNASGSAKGVGRGDTYPGSRHINRTEVKAISRTPLPDGMQSLRRSESRVTAVGDKTQDGDQLRAITGFKPRVLVDYEMMIIIWTKGDVDVRPYS